MFGKKSATNFGWGNIKGWFSKSDVKSNLSDIIYRGDDAIPSTVFTRGFNARGDNTSIPDHLWSFGLKNSAYIPTTKSSDVGSIFASTYNGQGFLYKIDKSRYTNSVDINDWLTKNGFDPIIDAGIKKDYRWQKEIGAPGRIFGDDILGAWPVDKQGQLGKFIKNKNK